MAKKNTEKVEDKKNTIEVETVVFTKEPKKEKKEVESIIEEDVLEPLNVLQEEITLDTEKIAQELEEIKEEIFDTEIEKVIEEKETVKTNKTEKKENKTIYKRLMGYIWNGQEYDY